MNIKRSPVRGRAIAHKAQVAGTEKAKASGSKVDCGNTTKKMIKPIGIERVVKSSRRGMDRSMAAQIETQDGCDAVHKKCSGSAMQKKRGSQGLKSWPVTAGYRLPEGGRDTGSRPVILGFSGKKPV